MLNSKARIAVLVSGGGTNLQALINSRQKVLKSGEITLVVSNKANAYALERAKAAGITCAVVEKNENFERNLIDVIEKNRTDFIILAGFMCILSSDFTKHFENRIINVHPSLIPSFCGKGFYGLHVHEAALEYGVKVTGATVHFVNEVPDGGRIILQKAVNIRKNDTPQTLQQRVMQEAEWKILPRAAEIVSKQILKDKYTK